MIDPGDSDRRVRRRWRSLTGAGLILMGLGFGVIHTYGSISPESARTVDIVRVAGFILLALVLSIRSTTAFTLRPRNPQLDDEHTRANRRQAARFGFWAMMLTSVAACGLTLFVEIRVVEALLTVLFASAAAATFEFVRLERSGADAA